MSGLPGPSVPPAVGPYPVPDLPRIERARLANGLEILMVARRNLPVVDIQLVVRSGAAADDPSQAGRASLTAELLDEGTALHDSRTLAESLDHLGAALEVSAAWDASMISLHVLSPRLGEALRVAAEVATQPVFPVEEVVRIRDERIDLLLQQHEEPRFLAARGLSRAMYGEVHPYGSSLLGDRRSLEALTREHLVEFYATHYRPANAFVVATGDLDPEDMVAKLDATLGAWSPADVSPLELPAAPLPDRTTIHLIDRPGAPQSEIRVGQAGPPRSTPDYYALIVLNSILGGAYTSRLNRTLREELGYTYGAGSRFDFRRGPGPFVCHCAVQTSATAESVGVILDHIRRIREEAIEGEELERARNYLTRGVARNVETTGDLASYLTEITMFGLPDDHLHRYIDAIQAVTAADLSRVARRHLDPERMAVVVVGDRSEVEGQLERLGLPVEIRVLDRIAAGRHIHREG